MEVIIFPEDLDCTIQLDANQVTIQPIDDRCYSICTDQTAKYVARAVSVYISVKALAEILFSSGTRPFSHIVTEHQKMCERVGEHHEM